MNFIRLQYFCDVARLHSFSKAAQENFVSQTAVSQQVAKLEAELDLQLIDRTDLPIKLTMAGETIYQRTQILLTQYQLMLTEAEKLKNGKRVLRIAYPNGAVEPFEQRVLPVLNKVKDTELLLLKSNLNDMQTGLLDQTVDVAITFDSEITETHEIAMLPLLKGYYDIFVVPEHPWYKTEYITSDQLSNERLIYVANHQNSNSYVGMQRHAEEDGVELNVTETVADIETALLLVQLNKGVTFIADYKHLNDTFKSLHRVKVKDSHHHYELCLAWLKSDSHRPELQNLIASLQDRSISL